MHRAGVLVAALLAVTALAGCGADAPAPTPAPEQDAPASEAAAWDAGVDLQWDRFDVLDASRTLPPDETAVVGDEAWVLAVTHEGSTRAYPMTQMGYHHVINDVLAGHPVAVTFCLLSGHAAVFSRRDEARVDRFGVAGHVWGTVLLYDQRTRSLWSQITGACKRGFRKGQRLTRVADAIITQIAALRERAPGTEIVDPRQTPEGNLVPSRTDWLGRAERPTGLDRTWPDADPRLAEHAPVAGFQVEGVGPVAVPLDPVVREGVRTVRLGDRAWVFLTAGGAGEVQAFRPTLDGADVRLSRTDDGRFRDAASGNVFDAQGTCVQGPAAGARLARVPVARMEWYAWHAHYPDTLVVAG